MEQRVGLRVFGFFALCLLLAGCSLLPTVRKTDEAKPTPVAAQSTATGADVEWTGRSGVGFSMDLPQDWHDLTSDYKRRTPDTVLSSFFAIADDIDAGTGFATVSTDRVGKDTYPRRVVGKDLDSWAADMTDPVMGPDGGIQTDAGGAGWWGSVTGELRGKITTIHSIHFLHGSYELMVLIESYEGEQGLAQELLDSLKTVTFTEPSPVEGRHGTPEIVDGRWLSYCGTISAAVQDWDYDFIPEYDSTGWRCPEDVDYLGAWVVTHDGRELNVTVELEARTKVDELRTKFSIPDTVGVPGVSPRGYGFLLTQEDVVPLEDGTSMTVLAVTVTTPDGVESQQVAYLVPLGDLGSVMVLAAPADDGGAFDGAWLSDFAASVRAET